MKLGLLRCQLQAENTRRLPWRQSSLVFLLKPTVFQAVFTIYSSARSEDLSEANVRTIFKEGEKKGYDPRTGLPWLTNHSLFSCEETVGGSRPSPGAATNAHPGSPSHPRQPVWSMLSWSLTTTARQPVVWGRLWGQVSARGSALQRKCLVRPAGQAPRPANNHRLTAAVASPTCAHGKKPGKPSRRLGHDRSGVSVLPTAVAPRGGNGPSDERCNCRSQASKLAGVKNGFYCCSKTDLIALPNEV